MHKSRIHCLDKQAMMIEVIWNALNYRCGDDFSIHGWDGVDAHWPEIHENMVSYENVWKIISKDKYVEVMLASTE